MIIDPTAIPAQTMYRVLIGSVVPRPIAFVSTMSTECVLNLAPFSFFNAFCADPPVVGFGPVWRNPPKDTIANIRATKEFVVNVVSEYIAEQMNICSGEYPPDVDEFAVSTLTPVMSEVVKPPRVKESPVALECRYWRTIELPTEKGHESKRGSVVFGQVVGVHIDDSIIKDGRIDTLAFKPVARLGYSEYTTTDNVWRMRRPDDPKYQ